MFGFCPAEEYIYEFSLSTSILFQSTTNTETYQKLEVQKYSNSRKHLIPTDKLIIFVLTSKV